MAGRMTVRPLVAGMALVLALAGTPALAGGGGGGDVETGAGPRGHDYPSHNKPKHAYNSHAYPSHDYPVHGHYGEEDHDEGDGKQGGILALLGFGRRGGGGGDGGKTHRPHQESRGTGVTARACPPEEMHEPYCTVLPASARHPAD
jgi:hypothetical protein